MVDIPFFKKLNLPKISLNLFSEKPSTVVGIDIGVYSTKVVQLRYEKERAILETYGELLNAGYFKSENGAAAGFLHYSDADLVNIVKDVVRESNVTAKNAVFSIPASSSFITTVQLPQVSPKEIDQAIPFEARKYIPIPISEVVLDWEIQELDEERRYVNILLVAVPREIIEKFKRVTQGTGLHLAALEVETFSMVRALGANDPTPTIFINLGYQTTTAAITDRGKIKASHNFSRGSQELSKALERGLGVNRERAEATKREVGISEKIEEREITSVITPFIETLFAEIERFISVYNRRAPRTIQKINFTGSGSNLKGLVEYGASRLGIEITRGNPFARVVTPAFMQPLLREIGPGFSVAVGLALHEIASK